MQPEVNVEDGINYKKKYKTLKRKLKMLIYEQECFAEELRRAQRKLLRISRDKSFLLDRLIQYEQPEQRDSDSDATASFDGDNEAFIPPKRRKTAPHTTQTVQLLPELASSLPSGSMLQYVGDGIGHSTPITKPKSSQKNMPLGLMPALSIPDSSGKKKAKAPKKTSSKGKSPALSTASSSVTSGMISPIAHLPLHRPSPHSKQQQHQLPTASSKSPGGGGGLVTLRGNQIVNNATSPAVKYPHHSQQQQLSLSPEQQLAAARSFLAAGGQTITMSQEELERHLELKQGNKPQFMNLEKTTPMLPENIFSNENSNSCEFPDSKTTDEEDLVIDIP